MKASIEWLNEFADIDVTPEELIDKLTLTGTKVETLDQIGKDIKNVVVGKILEIKKHPNADKLVVTKVNIGDKTLQIVTGAKNINVGDIIPVCLDGAQLPGGKTIKTGELRGELSQGMMCSISELGISLHDFENQIEDGIMILPKEYEKKLGQDIVDVLNLREDIIDFEITPNRVDCLGVEGIGRETAVTLDVPFKDPNKDIKNARNVDQIEGLRVNIEDGELCNRYIARVVKNIRIEPSPSWLKRRLKTLGVRSINNIVDITNYVMLEMGQPMHAFDIENISGKQINVRAAKQGEKITTLDGNEHVLTNQDIVICDDTKPVALAGVMGGLNSEITENTKTLVFESAVFKRGNIRLTSKRHNLRTESSSRFEKGLSPENAQRAISRACQLVELLNAGDVIDEQIDVYPKKQEQSVVILDVNKINTLIGLNLSYDYMVDILKKLEFTVICENNQTKVIAPSFRLDIESNADLAEEVLRFYGYDKLESKNIDSQTTIGLRNKEQAQHVLIENYLKLAGFCEIYTFGFLNEKELDDSNITGVARQHKIQIKNPLSTDFNLMRPSTIPSMLKVLKTNKNKSNENVKLFDISRIYLDIDDNIAKDEIPDEQTILTLGLYGKDENFYTLKGYVENLLCVANINSYQLKEEQKDLSYHPGRCARIDIGKDSIATFGQIHPKVASNYELDKETYLAQINLSKLIKYSKKAKKYEEIAKYPAILRDIAIIVDEDVKVGDIENLISKVAKKYIEEIKLFDIYRSDKIGENKKSLAFSLKFRDKTKTIDSNLINDLMDKILDNLVKTYDAKLR